MMVMLSHSLTRVSISKNLKKKWLLIFSLARENQICISLSILDFKELKKSISLLDLWVCWVGFNDWAGLPQYPLTVTDFIDTGSYRQCYWCSHWYWICYIDVAMGLKHCLSSMDHLSKKLYLLFIATHCFQLPSNMTHHANAIAMRLIFYTSFSRST